MKEGSAPIALYYETPFKSPGIALHEHPPVPGSAPIALCHETPFKSPPIALYHDLPFQAHQASLWQGVRKGETNWPRTNPQAC